MGFRRLYKIYFYKIILKIVFNVSPTFRCQKHFCVLPATMLDGRTEVYSRMNGRQILSQDVATYS